MKTLKPTGSNILVQIVEPPPDKLTIQIPEEFRVPSLCGVVIATGPGTIKDPMLVKPGSKVVLPRFGGTELDLNGTKHQIIAQEEFIKSGLVVETA
jgi:co-chaperonin GroES (HSP10)